ncbi:MAG: hypothetical protein RLZ21_203, partial [Pseudomonadota bacterium]
LSLFDEVIVLGLTLILLNLSHINYIKTGIN